MSISATCKTEEDGGCETFRQKDRKEDYILNPIDAGNRKDDRA